MYRKYDDFNDYGVFLSIKTSILEDFFVYRILAKNRIYRSESALPRHFDISGSHCTIWSQMHFWALLEYVYTT